MKLYYYRGRYPNFGDELNTWLLPRVFPNLFDDDNSTIFLGIGSVLFNHHPADSRKVVFGSGYGGYTPLPTFDDNWLVYCVRGPRTANVCGLGNDSVAGDAAILINRYRKRQRQVSRRIAFIPHWESLERGYWQEACRLADIHFIDPRRPVEDVLVEIESSTAVIAEAMHGAIVADALRVPWIPVLPLHNSHHFKWFDWAESLDLKLSPHSLWPSSMQEALLVSAQRKKRNIDTVWMPLKVGARLANAAFGPRHVNAAFTSLAASRLSVLARKEPMLSADASLARAIDRLEVNAERIVRDFPRK